MRTKLLTIISIVIALAGCRPETLPELGNPINKLKLSEGNWQLDKVVQTDLNASRYNFPYKELDVTTVAPFNNFKMSLTLSDGKSGTFTTNPGTAPKIIRLSQGKWEVDNANAPVALNLINGTDTVKMQYGSYNTLEQGRLHLKLTKSSGSKNLIRYDYYFKKI